MKPHQIQRVLRRMGEAERLKNKRYEQIGLSHPQEFATRYVPNWQPTRQHEVIGSEILKYVKKAKAENKTYYIIINMPPRHGKSVFISGTYPSFHLCHYPSDRILLLTHSVGLAKEFSISNRDILEENDLPCKINQNRRNAEEWWTVASPPGGIKCGGVTSKILGKGFQVIIMDDVYASEYESQSDAYRRRLQMIYDSSIAKRMEPGGIFLLPATRWDLNDLPQYIIDTSREAGLDDRVITLNFPAIAERGDPLGRKEGEALLPFRYPVEKLLEIKATTPPHIWDAQFMGSPQKSSGNFFREDDFRHFWEEANFFCFRERGDHDVFRVIKSDIRFFQFWDTTLLDTDTSDFTVCVTVGIFKFNSKYLIFVYDVFRKHVQISDLLEVVLRQKEKHPYVLRIFVEEASSGFFLKQTAQKRDIPIFGIKPGGKSKEERAMPLQSYYSMGNVLHCKKIMGADTPWLKDFEYELLCFRGKYNDQVDALAYSAIALQSDMAPTRDRRTPVYGLAFDYSPTIEMYRHKEIKQRNYRNIAFGGRKHEHEEIDD